MRTFALVTLASLALTAPRAHALDAEEATAYRWRVLVGFDPHPLATRAYRAQTLRELAAALTPLVDGVGTLAVVEVGNAPGDPTAQRVKRLGFAAFDDPASRAITGDKTHLVRVGPDGAGVLVRVRGLDGSTGLATPALREARVRDLSSAGRAAGLLVGREFGPVGTLDPCDPGAERVRVRFRAGSLAGFDRHVRAGDVFALTRVRDARAGPIGEERDYTLLRAESDARAGRVECRVLTRFDAPFRTGRGVRGFRVVKLATATAPLTLKLLDPAGKPPPPGNLIQVRASDIDFLPRTDGRDRLTSEAGVYRAARPFRGVACVVVSVGTVDEQRFPVAVTGPGPVTLAFQPDPEAQKRAVLELARDELRVRLAEAFETHAALVGDLAKQLDAGRNAEALARGEQGLAALAAMDGPLADDLKRYAALAGPDNADLAPLGQALTRLKGDRARVQERVAQLKVAVAAKGDPGRFEKDFRAKDLKARVQLALDRGDVPEAADLLEQLARIAGDPKVLETRARLQAEYAPRSEDHARARESVAGALGGATTLAEFARGLNKLDAATKTLVEADDRYGLRAVAAAIEASYPRLKEVLDGLDAKSDRGVRDLAEFKRVTDALRALQLTAQGKAAGIEAGAKP